MESKKINQLATELAPELSDLTIIGDPTTGISKKITLSQMASLFTGTVEEYANLASFPLVGTADTIYIALDTNIIYRWNTGTSAYVELSPNIVTSLVFNDANGFDGTISLVGSTATLTITTALTQGSIGFIGASGALTQDNSNFFWDNTNKRLGINTNAPTTAIDAFGSGIIGRLNGTSTNNAFLGFASAGSNKWSIGNVQSDHRFRIYSEANAAELVSVLQTGEVGIGIANPLTKLHIFGGASALIANLDANTSVAKSISFRSGNSSRINLEVSGTESGSNAGADLFVRTYTDAGALAFTPLTIKRSTGDISVSTKLNVSGAYIDYQNTSYVRFSNSGGGTRWGYIQHDGTNIAFVNEISGGNFIFTGTNVGIGMTPTKKFQVNTGTNAIFTVQYDTTDKVEIGALSSASGYKDLSITGSTVTIGTGTSGGGSAPVKMTILPSGNVGIGTIAPNAGLEIVTDSGSVNALRVVSNRAFNLNTDVGITFRYLYDSTNYTSGGLIVAAKDNNTSGNQNGNMQFYTNGGSGLVERLRITSTGAINIKDGTLTGAGGFEFTSEAFFGARFQSNAYKFMAGNNSTEYLRIDSGRVLMNTTSVLTSGWLCIAVASDNYNAIVLKDTGTSYSSNNYYQIFTNSSNTISGSISHNTATTIGFNTSSDYRLKEDFKDFNGLDILSKIKFYDFKWKEENKRMHGVIAHELQPLLPLAVSGIKDAIDEEGNIVAQGVDYSKIVPILGKALQQAINKIEQLEAKLA